AKRRGKPLNVASEWRRRSVVRRRSSSTPQINRAHAHYHFQPLGSPTRSQRPGPCNSPASPNRAHFLARLIKVGEHPPMNERDDMPDLEEVSASDRPLAIPDELPILPLRDTVLFPNSFMPLAVARESSVRLIDEAISAGKLIGVFTQRDASV